MKIAVKDLTGSALDWAVAKCAGMVIEIRPAGACDRPLYVLAAEQGYTPWVWKPSTDWSEAGPIIEREKIESTYYGEMQGWAAYCGGGGLVKTAATGPTLLIAVMRCFVSSRLGAEVEIPDEVAS